MQAPRLSLLFGLFIALPFSLQALTLASLSESDADFDEETALLVVAKPEPKNLTLLLAENQVQEPAVAPAPAPGLNYTKPEIKKETYYDRTQKEAQKSTHPKKNIIVVKKDPAPEEQPTLPRRLFEHQNVEDIEIEKIVSPNFAIKKKNGTLTITGKYRPELFAGRNVALFNGCDVFDETFFIRHTIDLTMDATCGAKRYEQKASELKFTLRNKGVWGNFGSIAPTSEVAIKDIDAKIGAHKHVLGRHVVWVREVWLKTLLNAALDLSATHKHYLTIGYYPFRLGRGIALGDAYSVNPGILGFYTENVVDQYAPGIVLSGDLITDKLSYDIYWALFENKAESVASNSEPIYLQRYGRRNSPERGFGSINWLLAGRLQWVALDNKQQGTLEFEPYVLYNRAPEQKIEFGGDSSSHLGTIGLDVDYEKGNFECSAEGAFNLGSQDVFGWDRNTIVTELDPVTADVRHVNSHVLNLDGTKALDIKSNQTIINSSLQSQALNGKLISPNLRNAVNRFNDPYCTPFRGWMAVADAGYWFLDKQVQWAVAAGIASGDENPNINLDDPKLTPGVGDYSGFVGLQEIYTGDRVESAFFLGQRLTRPLSLPNDAIENGVFASATTGFTNLIYAGTGFHVKPKWNRKPYWRPNLLFFWQQKATKAFDCATKQVSCKNARNFLGTELNSFFNMTFADCIGATIVAAVFIPGGHYADIKGTPLNRDQLKLLVSETPDVASQLLLSTDPAFMLNIALEYKF